MQLSKLVEEVERTHEPVEVTKNGHRESPWSTTPLIDEAVGPLIYFPMVWSRCDEVSAFAAQLAQDHGLNCYDPQWGRLRTELSGPWQFEITSERAGRYAILTPQPSGYDPAAGAYRE